MKFYVDTADIAAIERIARYFPIVGFTTNPKILASSPKNIAELMAEYKEYVETTKLEIFLQVTAEKAEDMLAQAESLQNFFGDRLVIKIPATKEGYRAVRGCKSAGIPVAVTTVHSAMQALVAAEAGADYVAPYISHIDNMGAAGIGCVEDILSGFMSGGYSCKVLGASFRTVDQILRLAVCGCDAVTLAPELFDALVAHPATTQSMAGFARAWAAAFGAAHISDGVPK